MNNKINTVSKPSTDNLAVFEDRLATFTSNFTPSASSISFDENVIKGADLSEGVSFFPFKPWRSIDAEYSGAVMLLVKAIQDKRKFQVMFGEGRLKDLQCQYKTVTSVTKIFDQQLEYPIKVMPVQCDGRYSGSSVIKALTKLSEGEFPVYTATVLKMLLAEPDILSDYRDTGIICAGDRITLNGVECVPVFRVDESGELVLEAVPLTKKFDFFSIATGFVLK